METISTTTPFKKETEAALTALAGSLNMDEPNWLFDEEEYEDRYKKKKPLDNKDPDNPEYYTGELNE